MKHILSYNEALELIKGKLLKVPNKKKFCQDNNINYTLLIALKNNKMEKNYPKQIVQILKIFGYKTTIIKTISFKVSKKE